MTAIDATSCRYTNVVTSHPTNVFMDFLDTVSQTFEQAAAHERAATGAHNRLETPRYAASLERKALATAKVPQPKRGRPALYDEYNAQFRAEEAEIRK